MSISIADSTLAAWAILEHVRTAKRWRDEDIEWIKTVQELQRESLVSLVGHDKATKAIANSRIALRKKQDELREQRTEQRAETSANEVIAVSSDDHRAGDALDQLINKGYQY